MQKLCTALAEAFAEFEGASKSKPNPAFRSKYADLSAVIDAIKPALVKHGLFYSQATHDAEGGVCVETIVSHTSGEQMSFGKLYVPAAKRDPHGYGSALTYARRYSLMTAFGIPAEDDDGNKASEAVRAEPKADPIPNDRQARIAADRDAPFPAGPCKNKTDLKAKGRDLWKDVAACGDSDELVALLASNAPLVKQLKEALPQWWNGGTRDGEAYEGLGQVIERMERDFADLSANRLNPLNAG